MHDRHGRRHGLRLGWLGCLTWAAFLAARRALAAERPWAARSNSPSPLAQREAGRRVGPGTPTRSSSRALVPSWCLDRVAAAVEVGGGRPSQVRPERGNLVCLKGSKCPQPLGMTDNAHHCISLSRAAEARLRLRKKKGLDKGAPFTCCLVLLCLSPHSLTQRPTNLPPTDLHHRPSR